MYVHHMTLICTEIRRVLRKSGSFYLVIGDTFAGSHCGSQHGWGDRKRARIMGSMTEPSPQSKPTDYEPKCLMGIPWRVAFALVEDGWILRNAIICHKPNAMPSSVKDRLAQTYEYIFHLVKSNRYYYNLDAVREPHSLSTIKRVTESTVFQQKGGVKQDVLRGPRDPSKGNQSRCAEMVKSIAQGYNSKYAKQEHGQTLQGLVRGQTQFQERLDSHTVAKQLFPNDPQKQQGYINYVHDHGTNPLGKNPGDILQVQPEGHGHDRWAGQRGEGLRPWQERFHPGGKNPGDVFQSKKEPYLQNNPHTMRLEAEKYVPLDPSKPMDLSHPKGKNPGDVLRIGVHHGSSVTTGRATYYEKQKIESDSEGKNPGDFWSITTKGFKGHHYAVYPERICVRPILAACPSDGIILDPMCGSGTTLVVAKKLGRKWIGIELNPDYISIIKKRLSTIPEKLDSFFK